MLQSPTKHDLDGFISSILRNFKLDETGRIIIEVIREYQKSRARRLCSTR
jgi:hypothetical protein